MQKNVEGVIKWIYYEVFHDILVNLFQEIMDIEGKSTDYF